LQVARAVIAWRRGGPPCPTRLAVRGRGWPLRVTVRWHVRAGLQRGWQARPPGIVPVLDKRRSGYGAALTSLPTAAPRI